MVATPKDEANGQTWRVVLAYRGGAFAGWQHQINGRAIQTVVEAALTKLDGRPTPVTAAGRTDAGVHAHGQVISFSLRRRLRADKLILALGSLLPNDISALRAETMPTGFSALRHSVGKHYRYRIIDGIARDPFANETAWHHRGRLDAEAMAAASVHLAGEHDYEAFRSIQCQAAHARRTVWQVEVTREPGNREVTVNIRGNAFCHNMVRIMVGTLTSVGRHKRTPESVRDVVASRIRSDAGVTAPSLGLSLIEVFYPDDLSRAFLPASARFPRYPVTPKSWPFGRDARRVSQVASGAASSPR